MRISACPLLLALFALVSSVQNIPGATNQTSVARWPSAEVTSGSLAQKKNPSIGQFPQTENVRPRVALTGCKRSGEQPLVTAKVDRRRVPLGELVTFTLSPAKIVLDPHYTVIIIFGDEKEERISQTTRDHLYTKTGTFTYCVLVKPPERPTTPTLPEVKLLAKPTSVKPDSPVNFKAELSRDYPNLKFRFVFADGSQTDWQDSQLTTHSYRSPGTYQAYVDIGLGNGRSVKREGGSPRRPIEVTSAPAPIAVQLKANRVAVQAKDEVTFVAQADPAGPNLGYRFSFGDRSKSTEWQTSPQTKHAYSSSGTYAAGVEVRAMNSRPGQQSARSKPLAIKVEAEQISPTEVNLLVVPRSVTEGFPVYFKATANPANSKTRYRFNFGDGSPPTAWKVKREETHIYKAGDYLAFVEITGRPTERVVSSNKEQVGVTPGISTGPTNEPTPSKERPTPMRSTPTPSKDRPTPSTSTPTPSKDRSTPTPVAGTPTPFAGTPTPGGPTPTGTPTPSSDGSPTPDGVITSTPSPGPTPSPSATASPTPPTDSGSWDDWWKYVLVA
ncbi:MAG TPA: PKD domain-containing protein, partial [Pyrinomonadaceae bacterium]|nr:PKD domain-containing protein [Pyrinomonadaceae bacterium]